MSAWLLVMAGYRDVQSNILHYIWSVSFNNRYLAIVLASMKYRQHIPLKGLNCFQLDTIRLGVYLLAPSRSVLHLSEFSQVITNTSSITVRVRCILGY